MKTIAIIGIGALGTRAARKLSGKCRLILVDKDIVEQKNLSNQKLFTKKDIGMPKATAALIHIRGKHRALDIELEHDNIALLKSADIIVDCTDNLYARQLINEFCKKNRKPWIFASVSKASGMAKLFLPEKECFYCIFGEAESEEDCTLGVSEKVLDRISSLQAKLCTNHLIGKRDTKLYCQNKGTLTTVTPIRNKRCRVCKRRYPYLNGDIKNNSRICGNIHQFRSETISKLLKGRPFLVLDKATLFIDGRALIKAKNQKEAKRIFSKVLDAY